MKSSMPVFVVFFSLLLGQRFHCKTYGALTMIITGVAITSRGEASFNGLGFVAALGSTMAGAAYGFIMKKALIIMKLHEFQMLTLISGLSLVLLLPVWLIVDFRQIFLSPDNPPPNAAAPTKIIYLLLADGLSRYLQNSLGVMLLARLTPLGYSVGNVLKRLFSIISSLLFFATPVTLLHTVGFGIAMSGLLAYNLMRAPSHHDSDLAEPSCRDPAPEEHIHAAAAHTSAHTV
uniref:Solute carrier family 35 member E1 homolog n=1 Tax=Schistocephalus solidus TaxID=70667 RepID=A0A0X3PNQ1_SCHSO